MKRPSKEEYVRPANVRLTTLDQLIDDAMLLPKSKRQHLYGPTVSTTAEVLKISRQRVYQLIKSGQLDAVEILETVDYDDPAFGNTVGLMVTWKSLKQLQSSDRKPGPKPKARRANAR